MTSAIVTSNTACEPQPVATPLKNTDWKLYTSHFLSTWNSRSFEFGAVLFLASIYPNTLLQLSIYALIRSASAIALAPTIGRVIDRKSRLSVVRSSIVLGRLTVSAACIMFWIMGAQRLGSHMKTGLFALVTFLACVEKPASVLNLVAVERDWVVVICNEDGDRRRKMNARMRRIDLICKLVGPLFIALIDGVSTTATIWTTFGLNILSLPVEYILLAKVYKSNPGLHHPKTIPPTTYIPSQLTPWQKVTHWTITLYHIFKSYFSHTMCPPSFALALLYLTVLSLSGQMVTYLLSAGYTAFVIALVRTLSVVSELSATWIAPRLMQRAHVARVAMWCLSWQMMWLAGGVVFFWTEPTPLIAASGLVGATILSRTGLWGYDLCAQFMIQEGVQENMRGSFSTTEASFQNGFELVSYALTIGFSRPDQFRYPVLVSAVAVFTAGALFARYLRRERGHLTHVLACVVPKKSHK